MDIAALKISLTPWIRTDTWYKSHPGDEKRFHQELRSAFESLGPSIETGDFRQAIQEAVDEHHSGMLQSKEIVQRIEYMAERAGHISCYLEDTSA